jgi:hypothetical protein
MKITPQEIASLVAKKTDQELQDMFARPEDWIPLALDAARTELQKRNIRPIEVAAQPAPNVNVEDTAGGPIPAKGVWWWAGFVTLGACRDMMEIISSGMWEHELGIALTILMTMFEAGAAKALGKPVLAVLPPKNVSAPIELPTDIAGVLVLDADRRSLDSIADTLLQAVPEHYAEAAGAK